MKLSPTIAKSSPRSGEIATMLLMHILSISRSRVSTHISPNESGSESRDQKRSRDGDEDERNNTHVVSEAALPRTRSARSNAYACPPKDRSTVAVALHGIS